MQYLLEDNKQNISAIQSVRETRHKHNLRTVISRFNSYCVCLSPSFLISAEIVSEYNTKSYKVNLYLIILAIMSLNFHANRA